MSVTSEIEAPSPPNSTGIWTPSSFCSRAASIAAFGKRASRIDGLGLRRCRCGDGRRALQEGRAAVEKESFAGVFRERVAEAGFLHVHGRYDLRGFVGAKHLREHRANIASIVQQLPIEASRLGI